MFITPDFEHIRSEILRDIKNQLPDADTGSDSDFFIRASSVASVATGIYQHQSWIVRQIFADTADSDFLELHAKTRNLIRKPATTASGTADFTGTPYAVLPAGQEIRGETLSVITTQEVVIDEDGGASAPVRATMPGTASNTGVITPAELVSAPMGINSRVLIRPLKGGTEKETDAALLARYLDLIRRPPAGGNKYDYRRWALEVPGVTNAFVYPLRRGLGTVDVAIISADGLPSQDIIDATQAHIDDVRPVTAKNSLVLMPEERYIDFDIEVRIAGISQTDAVRQVQAEIQTVMSRLAPGEDFIRSDAETAVSLIPGIRDRLFMLPAGNVSAQVDADRLEWLQPGAITVRIMA
ncbi:TPA: baseplate J/gp47 family protein [Morganella morganii]|nr:baseplate J/gp47 family protein [Morganella morganii]HAT1526057.1 baseplate J/gp47 family protein [Morganella morganii]HDF2340926.1 baseplate J/gp47 family protein [Morganella morganii]HDF2362930.1 baseplate J/gp47 family protein [Morganella morganii]HDF2420854.1 baseplate J/gp47 family protein [Morganella morganii]